MLRSPPPNDHGVLPFILVTDGVRGPAGTRDGAVQLLRLAGDELGATALHIIEEGRQESGKGYEIEARAVLDRPLSEYDIPDTVLECRETVRQRTCVSRIRER